MDSVSSVALRIALERLRNIYNGGLRDSPSHPSPGVKLDVFSSFRKPTASEVRTPTHVPAQEMQEITYQVPSNGTSFDAAFQGWHKILNESEHVYNEVALFLTDGYAKVPTATVQGLLSEHGSRISSLTCVAFCADAGAVDVLNQISGLFESTPIEANVIRADSEESLIKIFADAAASCLVHHGRAHRLGDSHLMPFILLYSIIMGQIVDERLRDSWSLDGRLCLGTRMVLASC